MEPFLIGEKFKNISIYNKRFARIFCPIVVLFHLNSTFGQIRQVCDSCTSTTLRDAIAQSKPHDTIFLEKGIYKEHDIIVNKPLNIIGQNNPEIEVENKGYGFIVKSDSVLISGLTIKNIGESYTKDYAAIRVYRSKYCTFRNLLLENVFFGILIEKSHFATIENNQISGVKKLRVGSGNGIHAWHCSNLNIKKNKLHNLRDGIYFEFVTKSKITNNMSYDNLRYGLHFMFSNNDEYKNNIFSNNGSGVAVMFSKFIKMSKNKFTKNWGTASYGLLLKEIYDAEISNNIFKENTIGIYAEGTTRINYYHNNFISNGWGVKVSGACYSNTFKNNNFLFNALDLSYNSSLNDNSFDENYWSSYTGYDLDQNGFGDIPFRPVSLFSYIINKSPESIILLRSLFVDIVNFSEKVSPIFTPDKLFDNTPLMTPVQ